MENIDINVTELELTTPVPAAWVAWYRWLGFRSSISSYRKNFSAVASLDGADGNATGYFFDIESIAEDPFRRISGIVPAAQASYSLDLSLLNKTFEELDGRICKLMEYVKSENKF